MMFKDPLAVTCDRCGVTSEPSVAELLRLVASCPSCGAGFKDIGLGMRARIDEWGRFVALAELAGALEEVLGQKISDVDVEGVETLRDLAMVVQRRISSATDAEAESIKVVQRAAREVADITMDEIPLDLPLLDALSPRDWNQ